MQRSRPHAARTLRTLLVATLAAASGGCFMFRHKIYHLTYEVRHPKAVEPPPSLAFDFVSGATMEGASPRFMTTDTRTEGDFVIYSHSALVAPWGGHWALVVGADGYRYETFILPIDLARRPTEWTPWRKPDAVGTVDPRRTLMDDPRRVTPTAEVPPDCYEVRYRFDPQRDR